MNVSLKLLSATSPEAGIITDSKTVYISVDSDGEISFSNTMPEQPQDLAKLTKSPAGWQLTTHSKNRWIVDQEFISPHGQVLKPGCLIRPSVTSPGVLFEVTQETSRILSAPINETNDSFEGTTHSAKAIVDSGEFAMAETELSPHVSDSDEFFTSRNVLIALSLMLLSIVVVFVTWKLLLT